MNGWGKLPGFLIFGLIVAAACGGRTDALEGDYVPTAGTNTGATAGVSHGGSSAGSSAGRPSRGGAPGVAGAAGAAVGGAYPVAGYGGYAFGGSFPTGGYGGQAFGGSFPIAGYGGFTFGGVGAGGTGFGDCQSCLKNACTMQLVQCISDFGCISIFSCMQQSRCLGFECYSPDTCQKVIDQYGGPNGASMNELLQVVACGFTAGCQCG